MLTAKQYCPLCNMELKTGEVKFCSLCWQKMQVGVCGSCPAYLFDSESIKFGKCYGCRHQATTPPEQVITEVPKIDNKPRTADSWHAVFINVARALAKRSKDPSAQCGAVIVDSQCRIIGTGFNGPPPLIDDAQVPWNERPEKYDFIIHAEENAIWDAVSKGQQTLGSTLYVTGFPCVGCVLRMIRAGVKRIIHTTDSQPKICDSKMSDRVFSLLETQKWPKLEIYSLAFSAENSPILTEYELELG